MQATIDYIQNQEQHHQERSFEDEYLEILRYHRIPFDPTDLWAEDSKD
jgi:hypothetical protein